MNIANNSKRPVESLSLDFIGKFSVSQIEALNSLWINSIGEFVAAASTEEGREGLRMLLGLDRESFSSLLKDFREILGEDRFRELSTPTPGGPLGALFSSHDDQLKKKKDDPTKGDD